MPTNTDLVTDLPADFEVFGQAVDTSLADLKGGTTGQILSKATNTDMDFVWIANDQGDITGVTATSPLTGGGTSGAVTVGIQSATTSQSGAVQLSDSTSTTSSVLAATPTAVKSAYDLAASAYAPAFTNNFYAGKNKFINGNFGIWQRGTSFAATAGIYTADRWFYSSDGAAGATISRQTFTPGTAPVSGYEGQYFYRYARTSGTTTYNQLYQPIENVQTFAGQTATFSFWAKADAATTISMDGYQLFGTGGSGAVSMGLSGTASLTTSWQRFSFTASVPSIAGKTIGTDSALRPMINYGTGNKVVDIWGVQLEAGSTATPFQTATGTIQGELAACQRYYFRNTVAGLFEAVSSLGTAKSTTVGQVTVPAPVTMRVVPTSVDYSTVGLYDYVNAILGATAITIDAYSSKQNIIASVLVASGLTQYRPYWLLSNNSTSAYIGFSAEL